MFHLGPSRGSRLLTTIHYLVADSYAHNILPESNPLQSCHVMLNKRLPYANSRRLLHVEPRETCNANTITIPLTLAKTLKDA
jgi:hypothetical protein